MRSNRIEPTKTCPGSSVRESARLKIWLSPVRIRVWALIIITRLFQLATLGAKKMFAYVEWLNTSVTVSFGK